MSIEERGEGQGRREKVEERSKRSFGEAEGKEREKRGGDGVQRRG